MIERINKLSGNETPVWGKMNVSQMVSHLVQSGEMPFGHNMPDRSNFISKNFIKPLVLYVLPMPKEVKTSSEMNQQEGGRKPEEFSADKTKVIELTNKIGQLAENAESRQHPFFGPMNAKEWAIIAHKHIDHHLRQFGL